jgi:hypothetical protein
MLEELADVPEEDKSRQESIIADVTAIAYAGELIFSLLNSFRLNSH